MCVCVCACACACVDTIVAMVTITQQVSLMLSREVSVAKRDGQVSQSLEEGGEQKAGPWVASPCLVLIHYVHSTVRF